MCATRKTKKGSNPFAGLFLEPLEDIDGEFEAAKVSEGLVHLVLRKRIELLVPASAIGQGRRWDSIDVGTPLRVLRTQNVKYPVIVRRCDF